MSFPARRRDAPAVIGWKASGFSIWDWVTDISVPEATTVLPNTKWQDSGGMSIFRKTGVQGYLEALTFLADNVGYPMVWLYLDDWDVLAMAHWGSKYDYGIPQYLVAEQLARGGLTAFKVSYLPTEPIYFEDKLGIKFSNTSANPRICHVILLQIRFIKPDIIGRPKNDVAAYNDIAQDHLRG